MAKIKWFWLQMFAGEGGGAAGGTGASAGEGGGDGAVTGATEGVDAEHQRLLELGVPEEKLRKRAKRASANLPEGAVRTAPKETAQPQEQVATAENNPTEGNPENPAPTRMSWDEIKADPEYSEAYKKETQEMMKKRLRNVKASDEVLEKLNPALEVLALQHGLDPANIDYEKLAKAISDKKSLIEDRALEMGVTYATAEKLVDEELDKARRQKTEQQEREQKERDFEEQQIRNHFVKLEQQAEVLKKVFPNFDLRTELKNPVFARMLAPGQGIMSVEDAYYAVHRKEIDAARSQVIAQQTTHKISNAIQAGYRRPDENGTSGQSASVTTFDYSKASKAQREALKQQIRVAAARGEKVYPGR
jgi:hypothetical protein